MKHEKKLQETGLFLPQRELSWAIASVIILSIGMFCMGYFWGQRRAVSQFLYKVKEDSFADGVNYSLYMMGLKEPQTDIDTEPTETTIEEVPESAESTTESVAQKGSMSQEESPLVESSKVVYVAPLVGFGTAHAANSFAQRVQAKGIPVVVRRRLSKTKRGKQVVWYQAITQEYTEKEELEKVIASLQREEKLKGVQIIEQKKG